MADRTTLQDAPSEHSESNGDSTKNDSTANSENNRQSIFDARFATLTDGFGQACEQEGVELAIAIAIHPKEKHPMIFLKGHQYDVAALLAKTLKHMAADLMGDLDPHR